MKTFKWMVITVMAITMVIFVFPLITITFDVLTNQYKRDLNENSKGT